MQEKIQIAEELFNKYSTLNKTISEKFGEIINNAKERKHTITRNGAEVEVEESTLWFEVQNLGAHCEAGEYLKQHFADFFEIVKQKDEAFLEFQKFVRDSFGVDPERMSFIDVITLIRGYVSFELESRKL